MHADEDYSKILMLCEHVVLETVIIPIGCALSLSSDLASTLYDTIYDDIS